MKRLRAFLIRLSGLFPNQRREQELSAEIESHLAMHIEDNLRAGMSADEAERQALRQLGGVARTKEAWRDRRSIPFLENRILDLRFALRQMRSSPSFTITAALMVSVGICGSVAIFAFVDAALLKPLPYKDQQQLVGVYESVPMFPRSNLSYLDYLDWKEQNTVFESFDVYTRGGYLLSTPNGVEVARAALVSNGFFRTLGVKPILGRDFREGEDLVGAPRIVMLSHAVWQQRYGGSPDVLGQTIIFDGEAHEIIGVLPQDFHFAPAEPAPYWTPHRPEGNCSKRRSCHNLYGVARLKPGTSFDAALANVTAIAKRLEQQYPDSNRDQGAALSPLSEVIVGDIREILLVLLGGAVLLLLIATVNVANLLLVRAESRTREFALRNALGASANRLFSQFVTEGILLVSIASAAGLAMAYGAVKVLPTLIPEAIFRQMPYLHHIGANPRVLGFAALVGFLAVALFSITPLLRLPFARIREDLADGSRGSAGSGWRRLGSKLVVVELAMAIVLLVSAGLLSKSLYRLLEVHPGMRADRLVAIEIGGPRVEFDTDAKAIALSREVMSRIAALPGVEQVSIAGQMPVTFNGNTTWFRIAGRPHNGEHEEAPERAVGSAYFQTIGATLVRGRYFDEAEDGTKPNVAIVNQTLVRKFFPDENPIGKHLSDLKSPPTLTQIVGVVEDVKEGPLDALTPPVIYVPFNQSAGSHFVVVARTIQDEQSVMASLSPTVRSIHPGIVTFPPVSMRHHIEDSESVYLNRSSAVVVGTFAVAAFLLSIVGLYGVVAYSVGRRNREIGVRMALGAQQGNVYRLVLNEAAMLAVFGVGIGLACSLATTKFLRGMLFGIESWDISTLAIVSVTVAAAALLASYLPARRAASINPVEALRAE